MPLPSNRPLRVVMISAELESFARTGGLGDAVEALSRALAQLGAEVVVVTPRYGVTKVPPSANWWWSPITARVGWGPHDARELGVLEVPLVEGKGGWAKVCLLAHEPLFGARAGIYGDRNGTFGDNGLRFATLSAGALEVAARVWPDWEGPDVIHAHDWHAALAVLYPKLVMSEWWSKKPSAFTIHNLAYQGVFGRDMIDALGIPRVAYDSGWVAHEGNLNLMKGAIELADRVTAVSPTYAGEILRPDQGYGLDAHLRWHGYKLSGIANGIDATSFDPARDPAIARRYDATSFAAGKRACKEALLRELELDGDLERPLFATVSRLNAHKGIDLILDIAAGLVHRDARFVLVGQGEPALENELRTLARRFPGRVAARVAFDPLLARRIFAGSDFFMVPSRHEPCGLTQMYAMRYGSIPIVTSVGGLRDTVSAIDVARGTGTGLVAEAPHPVALLLACEDALTLHGDGDAMRAAITRAMSRDSAWVTSAKDYLRLYGGMLR